MHPCGGRWEASPTFTMVNKRVWCAFPILRHDRVQGLPSRAVMQGPLAVVEVSTHIADFIYCEQRRAVK